MNIKKLLDEKLIENKFISFFDKENNVLRYEMKESGQGVNLDLTLLKPRFEKNSTEATNEIAYYVETSLLASSQEMKLADKTNQLFPVIRSSSFPKMNSKGVPFIIREHTAETIIYYALDLGGSYQLIDQILFSDANLSLDKLHDLAISNLLKKEISYKMDSVAGNHFYFINLKDGYDASRLLLTDFLDEMHSRFTGTMAVAVPHQDVLILCDIQNEYGYSILAEMTMKFFVNGNIPITSLSFIYEKNELKPIFIMK